MPPVDPTVLLNTIVYLLDHNGGLKNDRVVRQFITLMKLAEKLVNKSIYLQILSQTKSEEILRTFLKSDGHQILLKWLSHFHLEHNRAFLLDTLNILGELPFNLAHVSQNDINELQLKIAELASAKSGEDKDIRESAQHFYDIWLTKGVFKTFNSPASIERESSLNAQKMATTATLTAVSAAGTTDTSKRKSEELPNRKPTHRRLSNPDSTPMKSSSIDLDDNDGFNKTKTSAAFRIPKLGRPNANEQSPPGSTDAPESLSSSGKSAVVLNRQSSDELNAQQAKRKFSLSQYKEHKRLKSNEIQHNTSADTDMRIHQMKPSPPMSTDDDSANVVENQLVISPKADETSKDIVMKSNLSEPGVKKTVKKKVIWADEKNQTLVQTSFFEVDDSELSEMHIFSRTCAANISIAQLEKVMERDLRKRRGLQDINSNEIDDKQFTTPLPALIKISIPDSIQIPQIISQERFVQEEREKTVLQALFIRSFLPDSPGEPDGDLPGTSNTEPKLIPLEDDTSSTVSSKVTSSSIVNSNHTTTNNLPPVSTTTTNPITTNAVPTPSLSLFSLEGVSPQVAQILAEAKGKATAANNPSTTNTLINPSTILTSVTSTITNPTITATPNLPAPPNFLAALLNLPRTTGNETSMVPPPNSIANLLPNLPLNFNLPPPPTPFPLSLIANALTLGIPPPPTAAPSLYQTPTPATFTAPPNMSNPLPVPPPASTSSSSALNSKPPTVRFVSASGPQIRANLSNNHEHPMSSSRENSREHHHFRRGPPNNNRRDYYQNRNNNTNNNNNNNTNNNNRNIFS